MKAAVKVLSALLLRSLIIALAAYATAQPIEVLFFNGQIQKRIHDESVRSEAIAQFRDYQDKELKAQGADPANVGKFANKQAADAQKKLQEEQGNNGKLQEQVRRADQEWQAAEKNLLSVKNRRSKNLQAYNSSVNRATGRRDRAQIKAKEAQDALGANTGVITAAENAFKLSSEEVKGNEKQAESGKQRIVDWIKQLRRSNPGDEIKENTTEPNKFTFEDKNYDFFERMTIIDDLMYGRPPKWVGAEAKEVEELKKTFAFGDSADDARRQEDARSFYRQWFGLLVITLIFPVSIIAMKFLMSVDKSLMDYYSHQEQMQNTDYAVHLYSYNQADSTGAEERQRENGNHNYSHRN